MMNDETLKPQSDPFDDFAIHRQLVFWLFVATATIVLVTTSMLVATDLGLNHLSILPVVAIAGALGAFVSALRRIYSFQNVFPSKNFPWPLKNANLYIVAYSSIPPLIGLIAAVLLYIIFSSGLISGDPFPHFVCEIANSKCDQFPDYVKHWQPIDAQNYAKAIVWGFIAGFSERFVPDILNRIAHS